MTIARKKIRRYLAQHRRDWAVTNAYTPLADMRRVLATMRDLSAPLSTHRVILPAFMRAVVGESPSQWYFYPEEQTS